MDTQHVVMDGKIQPETRLRWKWRVARAWNSLFRFRDLGQARWAFGELVGQTWVQFPLFGSQMCADLSRSESQRLLLLMGERMVPERVLLQGVVQPGMRVVDVGANIGYYLLLLEQLVGPQGHVTCVEPSQENLPELRANIAGNRFENVNLVEVAVGAIRERRGYRPGINGGIVDGPESIGEVPVLPLDDLLSNPVQFIKIDVDGFEGMVLEGSRKVIERDRPAILLEVHPDLIPRFETSCRWLHDFVQQYYSNVAAYELPRPETMSLATKIFSRYFANEGLREIQNLDKLAEAGDAGSHPYTYWLLCRP